MQDTENLKLFCPMLAMFIWTGAMFARMAFLRVRGVMKRDVSPKYFELLKGEVPEKLQKAANNVNNLMQVPNLFYVACMFATFANVSDEIFLKLAWAYVGLRVIHSCIHVSYNKVIHRFAAFVLSNIVLVVFWVRLASQLG